MKNKELRPLRIIVLTASVFAGCLQASTVVYQEDFSSTVLTSEANPYLGGFYTPQIGLQQWTGAAEASITVGSLNVNSTNATRTAGIILPSALFVGPGDYKMTFDVTAYTGDTNNSGLVAIWAGSGYGPSGETAEALILDTYTGSLGTMGAAVSSMLGSQSFNTQGSKELNFTYDGTSDVALFFGVTTAGWPFPDATFDNILIETIPEPSVMTLSALLAAGALMRRKRC